MNQRSSSNQEITPFPLQHLAVGKKIRYVIIRVLAELFINMDRETVSTSPVSVVEYVLYRLARDHGLYIKPFRVGKAVFKMLEMRDKIITRKDSSLSDIPHCISQLPNRLDVQTFINVIAGFDIDNMNFGRMLVLAEVMVEFCVCYNEANRLWLIDELIFSFNHRFITVCRGGQYNPVWYPFSRRFLVGSAFLSLTIALATGYSSWRRLC